VYDEVQEEIATWERSLEEELKKFEEQVGLVGLIFQPLLRLTPSLDSASPIGTAISGTRYLCLQFISVHTVMLTDLAQDIYLVQTKVNQKDVPRDWIKSGGTKVGTLLYQQPQSTRTNHMVRLSRDGRSTPWFR